MKVALFHIAEKSAPFVATNFQFDTDLLQLFLKRFGDLRRKSILVVLYESRSASVGRRRPDPKAGFIEKVFGACRIIAPSRDILVVGLVKRRD